MTHSHAAAHGHDQHEANAPKLYLAVLIALLILTGITVGASRIQFGSSMVNVVIALTIATIKASLVALFFMHLLHDKSMLSIILVASFMFLSVFLGFSYMDQASREDVKPAGLKVKAPIAAPAGAPAAPAPGHEGEAHH